MALRIFGSKRIAPGISIGASKSISKKTSAAVGSVLVWIVILAWLFGR